jgi:hypothetical protein
VAANEAMRTGYEGSLYPDVQAALSNLARPIQ